MSASIPSNAVSSNGIGVVPDALLNTFLQTDQTAAQLRAFVGQTGMAVILQGITAPGDGGGGLFYWNSGSYTDNNSTVIVPSAAAGQGAWLLAALAGPSGAYLPLAGGTITGNLRVNGTTTLAGAVSGAGITALFASPPPTGSTVPNTGAFTTLGATGATTLSGGGALSGTFTGNPVFSGDPNFTGKVEVGGTTGPGALNIGYFPGGFPIVAGAIVPLLQISTGISGTVTSSGYFGVNNIAIPGDTAALTGSAPVLNDLYIVHNFGGTGFSGLRQGIAVSMNQTLPIAAGTTISGIASGVQLSHSFGGTNLAPAGQGTAMNPYFVMNGNFTFGRGGSGMEIDISGQTGSSFQDKIGLLIVQDGADVVQGSRTETGLSFSNQTAQSSGHGWLAMISSGNAGGYFPMDPGGSFWTIVPNAGGDNLVVNKGLAWANGTFTTSAIETPGFKVDGSGNITAPSVGNGSAALEFTGSAQWTANGSVATALSNIGPTGSHTTVQTWFTVKDSGGVTRYIPAF
jgi:hypothetical protein